MWAIITYLYSFYNFLLVEKNTREISTKTTNTHLYVKTHMETLNTQHTMKNVQKDHITTHFEQLACN
jgi:hypothetical protein